MDILQAIGATPLVQLRRVAQSGTELLLKLEGGNPTGSVKDRMALGVIERAERDGRLRPGGTVVEYTGGSTGASLALVETARALSLEPDTFRTDTGLKYLGTDVFRQA